MPLLGVPDPAVAVGTQSRAPTELLGRAGEQGAAGVCPLGAAGADVAADHVGEGGERQSGDTAVTPR